MPAPLLTRPGMHTAGVYVTYFASLGAHMPFWTLWLGDWGLSAGQIGLYTALGVAARVGAGLMIPALADRLDARRNTAAACAGVAALLFLAHLGIGSEAVLLAATVSTGAAMAGIGPIAEALGLAAARAHGFAYAHARGLGSAGFLVANLAAGVLIARLGVDVALWWIVVCLSLVAALMLRHPGGRRVAGQIPPDLREIRALILNPTFALFVATAAAIQASHSVLYAYGSIHWRALGLSEGRIGALWAASVAAEIALMLSVGGRAVARLGPVTAMALGAAAGLLRWGGMMADPTGWALWPLQALHAGTFALAHLGAMAFIARAVPPRFGAAAQGAMGAMAVGIGLALGMAAAALVYPALGGLTYAIGLLFSALGLALCTCLGRAWRGQTLGI